MSQHSKIKLFRTLKVVFYCLGLPLFFVAVVMAASVFKGETAFGGWGTAFFAPITVPLTAKATYGIWVAVAVWLVIAVVQLTLHFTVKNRKARMISAVAVAIVCMLVPVLVMDSVFTAKFDTLKANAPDGVSVGSYKEQLSYYRAFTGSGGATGKIGTTTEAFNKQIDTLLDVYHIGLDGADKSGTAGNMANNPIYYDELGIDYNKDGVLDVYGLKLDSNGNPLVDEQGRPTGEMNKSKTDHVLVTVAPTGAKMKKGVPDGESGWLGFNTTKIGETYYGKPIYQIAETGGNAVRFDEYYYCLRTVNGKQTYIWYTTAKKATKMVGDYGEAMYNQNGMLSDGYVFGLDATLEILEDYYGAKAEIDALLLQLGDNGDYKDFDTAHATIRKEAKASKYTYYQSSPELKKTWNETAVESGKYSLTVGELDGLVGMLIAAIGSNTLFEFLFDDVLGGISGDLAGKLANGMLISDLVGTILGIAGNPPGAADTVATILNFLGLTNVKIVLRRGATQLHPEGKYLTLGLLGGKFDEIINDGNTEFPKGLIVYFDESFNINQIDQLLKGLLGDLYGTIVNLLPTILGLFKVNLPGDITYIKSMLMGLLAGLYWYQSPVLATDYSFYENTLYPDKGNSPTAIKRRIQVAFAKYDKAEYEGKMHGAMIGSVLIGDKLGAGNYTSANGLGSLAAVQQVKSELSYIPTYFPLFSVRDMLMTFAGVVAFFMILSYTCAEKEIEWATGQATVKVKGKGKGKGKNKKGAGLDDADINNLENSDFKLDTPPEDTALNVAENTDKEVK